MGLTSEKACIALGSQSHILSSFESLSGHMIFIDCLEKVICSKLDHLHSHPVIHSVEGKS